MKIPLTVEYEPSPEELAEEFYSLYDNGMASFFNHIGELFQYKDEAMPLSMQLEYVSQSPVLNEKGRFAMQKIGEYARHNQENNND